MQWGGRIVGAGHAREAAVAAMGRSYGVDLIQHTMGT